MAKRKKATGKLSQTLAKSSKQEVDDLTSHIKELEKLISEQQASIERQKKVNYKFRIGKANNVRGSFLRLLIPDTHGSFVDQAAVSAMINDVRSLDIKEVVLLGDHLDCGGFLAQHHTLGYVADADYTFEQDVTAANCFLDEVQKACPKARAWYLIGNHEQRIERWCVTQALRSSVDSKLLLNLLATSKQLVFEKRGITEVGVLSTEHNTGNSRGVLELGKCLFLHGFSHAKHAAFNTLNELGHNCVIAHIHRTQSATKTIHHGQISAWCPGCLCELRQYYMHSRPTHHAHGYAIQVVNKDGTFLHISVPIIKGKSFLRRLLQESV